MRYKNNSGAAMIIVVTISAVLFGMLALSADMGYLFLARNQLQNAADSGALAGATKITYLYGGVTGSEDSARAEAIEYATKYLAADRLVEATDVAVDINSDASVFGVVGYTGPAIRVTVRRTGGTSVTLFFGRILGKPEAGVMATAVARLVPLQGTCEFTPWMIRDWPFSDLMDIGDLATLNYRVCGPQEECLEREEPGWFSPVQFPPITKPECGNPQPGGNVYRDNITSGSSCDCLIGIGDILSIQTGNMVGPTIQGVESLIAMDPNAVYNTGTNAVDGSQFADWTQSPRIVNALIFDHNLKLTPSTREVTVVKIAAFFINDISGVGQEVFITGHFVGITTGGGIPGDPGTSSFIFTAQLIR